MRCVVDGADTTKEDKREDEDGAEDADAALIRDTLDDNWRIISMGV